MNKWKLSYIIHTATWAILCVLALFYENIAHFPVSLMFAIAYLSYEILGLLTGATDPLATTQGGSRIPEFALDDILFILAIALYFLVGLGYIEMAPRKEWLNFIGIAYFSIYYWLHFTRSSRFNKFQIPTLKIDSFCLYFNYLQRISRDLTTTASTILSNA